MDSVDREVMMHSGGVQNPIFYLKCTLRFIVDPVLALTFSWSFSDRGKLNVQFPDRGCCLLHTLLYIPPLSGSGSWTLHSAIPARVVGVPSGSSVMC